jgi:hypothetical protein
MRRSASGNSSTQGRSAVSNPASYGLIVEGPYDKPFYEALIRRICKADLRIVTRPCGDVTNLMKQFPALLRDLEHVLSGKPVDKALVIRDANGGDIESCRKRMESKIKDRTYSFPWGFQLCVVRREMETWILADTHAINAVALARGGREVSGVQGSPEDIHDPKRELRSLLSEARVVYTAPVCGEIASELDIGTLEYRCPSFRAFKKGVLDC